MSVKLSDEKNKLIDDVAKSQGFENYNVQVTPGSMKGDGYLGIINILNIQEISKPEKQLHLVMKSAMTEEKLRETTPVRKAYDREIYMYETVFPEYEKLSEKVGIKNKFTETAKCYGSLLTDQQECIILENLKENDFRLWNREMAMDEQHVALVFATYAKFHASGIALKLLKPETFEEMSKSLIDIFYKEDEDESDKKKFEESCKLIFENGFRAITNNKEATQGLANCAKYFGKFVTVDLRKVDKFSTVVHGDCWCNNMLFKYTDPENSSRPTEMCFLDWQISQVGSPIIDLSYFFYACSSKEVLYSLKKVLKIYHKNFTKTIAEAGLNPEEVMSFAELEEQWKINSKYGLFMALFVMRVILSGVDEAPDLSELAKEGKDILTAISSSETINMEAINKRISDIIIFMNDNNYL